MEALHKHHMEGEKMLHKILENIGFVSALVGIGGIAGAIEKGSNAVFPVTLAIVGGILLYISFNEGGEKARYESDSRYYGHDASYPSFLRR